MYFDIDFNQIYGLEYKDMRLIKLKYIYLYIQILINHLIIAAVNLR